MKARPFDQEIFQYLDNYETEDCVIVSRRGKHIFPRGSQIVKSYPPVLLDDGWCWLLTDLVALPGGACIMKRTLSRATYVPYPVEQANPEIAWDMFSAEIEAYLSLTHLQGIILPYLYSIVESSPVIDIKKTSSLLYEHLDSAQFIPLGTWIGQHPVPKNPVIPLDMFEPMSGNIDSLHAQLDILYQVLESLLDLFHDEDTTNKLDNYNGLSNWDLVCIRTFLALRLIHVGGICHGNVNGRTILINGKTLHPVFVDFYHSVKATSDPNIIYRMAKECDDLKKVWLRGFAVDESSLSSTIFDQGTNSEVWWI
ncbi:hypothetical protein TRICI_004932 [Trichomonascus ciferrii]|uniref:Protein kinase domain-containing protein n=1 Tax=Trichomonascus ciferrii TaxID=44093 RepID=A0A642UXT4_9ASCO|nr:hypothetical protein TRICI_004932 [Trichomonascus ciferrii]